MMHEKQQGGGGMLHGAIFDLDGTLLDSMPVWNTLASTYLRTIGHVPRADVDAAVRALSLQQAARFFQSEYDVTLSEKEITDGIKTLIQHFYEADVQVKPGVPAILQQFSQQGVKMCIATATDTHFAKAALTRCGLMHYFTEIITCDEVGAGKDQPLIYRAALAALGTARAGTLVFEDARHALETAKADGFITIAVRDDSEPDWEYMKNTSHHAMNDFTETKSLWEFIARMNKGDII